MLTRHHIAGSTSEHGHGVEIAEPRVCHFRKFDKCNSAHRGGWKIGKLVEFIELSPFPTERHVLALCQVEFNRGAPKREMSGRRLERIRLIKLGRYRRLDDPMWG